MVLGTTYLLEPVARGSSNKVKAETLLGKVLLRKSHRLVAPHDDVT